MKQSSEVVDKNGRQTVDCCLGGAECPDVKNYK